MSAEQPNERRPVIVVSTGRCGSTLVSDMIRLHPELLSLSEFFVVLLPAAFPPGAVTGREFWRNLSQPKRRWTLMLRLGIGLDEITYKAGPPARFTPETGVPPIQLIPLPHLTDDHEAVYDELAAWVPTLDARPADDQYRRLFQWLCDRLGRQTWAERSGSSLGWLPELVSRFPEARFIHLYRDGRDCAISMSRHNAYKLTAVARRLYKRLGVDPFTSAEPPILPPTPALLPFMPDTFDLARYDALRLPLGDMGNAWSQMIVRGQKVLEQLDPDRVTYLRYETLMATPAPELRRLARFIGVAEDDRWISAASALVRPQRPRWPDLPPDQRRAVIDACTPGMELMYGTATELVGP